MFILKALIQLDLSANSEQKHLIKPAETLLFIN